MSVAGLVEIRLNLFGFDFPIDPNRLNQTTADAIEVGDAAPSLAAQFARFAKVIGEDVNQFVDITAMRFALNASTIQLHGRHLFISCGLRRASNLLTGRPCVVISDYPYSMAPIGTGANYNSGPRL